MVDSRRSQRYHAHPVISTTPARSSATPAIARFSWTQAGGLVELGSLGGVGGSAEAVNNSGQVVGQSTSGGDIHAFLWTQAGGMVHLGTLGGSGSSALDVNDSGQVVGFSNTSDGEVRPFSWTQAEGMVDLGLLGGPYVCERVRV